jgi:hypothetical protein
MSEKTLDEILVTLKEILKWVKFSGAEEVRVVLMKVLDTEQKRLIYYLSDGSHGSVEIGKKANVSDTTVRRYWESWARLGLAEPVKIQGGVRLKKSFELEDFGLAVPQTVEKINEKRSEEKEE